MQMIAIIALFSMIFSVNPIIEQQMLAWAQPMHTTDAANIINTTKNIHNATLPGQTVVYRGIISSEKPVHLILPPGLAPHGATILPQNLMTQRIQVHSLLLRQNP
jgi:hypothetical protein